MARHVDALAAILADQLTHAPRSGARSSSSYPSAGTGTASMCSAPSRSPGPRKHLVRFFGFYSNKSRGMRAD